MAVQVSSGGKFAPLVNPAGGNQNLEGGDIDCSGSVPAFKEGHDGLDLHLAYVK